MITVDCRGLLCPKPLIETRKAIKSAKTGDKIRVELDNDTSCKNVLQFLKDNAIAVEQRTESNVFIVEFMVPASFAPATPAEDYCEVSIKSPQSNEYIVVLDSNVLGDGDISLGEILMKGFLNTLPELDTLPTEIICYNGGVKLAQIGSDTAQALIKISSMGVKVSVCGTCVDFFGLKNMLAIGNISNMLYIAGKLTSGFRVVKP
ncbi:MAG TPA: sulfurtransferase-like selenium metabolism protein YedF [Tenuifilaceae bacterium]|nr:sulfurtransferase-like selenium metabolism protein YedF [Tenuifilaceae bacterium]HQB79390.1 sulfurtransferase-like selenium metabolism protein YedF [Tenuifilaceae bacterium]